MTLQSCSYIRVGVRRYDARFVTQNVYFLSGFETVNVIVDNVSRGKLKDFKFSTVISDHDIVARFAREEHTITATAGRGGTIKRKRRSTPTPISNAYEYAYFSAESLTRILAYHLSASMFTPPFENKQSHASHILQWNPLPLFSFLRAATGSIEFQRSDTADGHTISCTIPSGDDANFEIVSTDGACTLRCA